MSLRAFMRVVATLMFALGIAALILGSVIAALFCVLVSAMVFWMTLDEVSSEW
jgi:hypothetical protein